MRLAIPLLGALLLGLAACGEGPPRPDGPPPPPPQLVAVNKCPEKTPPFTALHLHTAIDNYRGTVNQLAAPLKVEESSLITAFTAGSWYLTVIREKLDSSATIAMTTRSPLELRSGIYELWIFQQSFRLHAPRDAGVAPRETGPGDRGADRRRDASGDRPPSDRGGDRPGIDLAPPRDLRAEAGKDASHD